MFRHTRFLAFGGWYVNDNKIVELVTANNKALTAALREDVALAVRIIEDEIGRVTTQIAELTDRLRRLEQGGGPSPAK
jgi:hypothetical protein